jgi:hypothetical protein
VIAGVGIVFLESEPVLYFFDLGAGAAPPSPFQQKAATTRYELTRRPGDEGVVAVGVDAGF